MLKRLEMVGFKSFVRTTAVTSIKKSLHQRVSAPLLYSSGFFLLCMLLDMWATDIFSQGDFTMEGNAIAQWWWQMAGVFRFIEIPIWAVVAVGFALVANQLSRFLGLFWLNTLAFTHLVGFLSWTPYNLFVLIPLLAGVFPLQFAPALVSVLGGALLALIQTRGRLV